MTPFRRLFDLFRTRFFENDTASPGGGFETNIYQVLGFLVTPGFYIAYFFLGDFLALAKRQPTAQVDWALRVHWLLFPAYSFAVVGFATVFEWDMLFPDRRDFLILSSFPIRLRTLFAAKFSALVFFVGLLIAAVNFFTSIMVPLVSLAIPQIHKAGLLRAAAAQIGATVGASAFAFFSVAGLQGLLLNITGPQMFRRISPWIQAIGMSLMILALLLFPVYSLLLPFAAHAQAKWLWFFPPIWFTGLYDLLLTHSDPLFASLGRFALQALGLAVLLFSVTWALGFRRHYRRTLETEGTDLRSPRKSLFDRLLLSPEEGAIFYFSGKILGRSAKHRLFLATYWSVGISIGLLFTIVLRNGTLVLSPDGLRSLPLLIGFFLVSGFRAAFQFPVELPSNWPFRLAEERWTEVSRRATRKRVFISGLAPALLLFAPLEMAYWGVGPGVFHAIFQLVTGALLIEILFWNFDKVPFTCSYFPGKLSLAFLAGLYLYGFTTYSFQMADLEKALETRPWEALWFFTAAIAALALSWRRRPAASSVRFDGNEPQIQPLDLT